MCSVPLRCCSIRLVGLPLQIDVTPIIPALTNVFNMALAGGGAKSINFQALAADLAQITFDYPFRIPPYFALIIRAIGVLEGIALVSKVYRLTSPVVVG